MVAMLTLGKRQDGVKAYVHLNSTQEVWCFKSNVILFLSVCGSDEFSSFSGEDSLKLIHYTKSMFFKVYFEDIHTLPFLIVCVLVLCKRTHKEKQTHTCLPTHTPLGAIEDHSLAVGFLTKMLGV